MPCQKISIISFDHWDYDRHISAMLESKGIVATHIKIGSFKHANFWVQIKNTFSKVFLNHNPKEIRRQQFIIEQLNEIGFQDQILVINPELIFKEFHLEIKKHTKKYIAYLYDSVSRNPITHLLDGVFDEIYSFDKTDIAKYGFKETTNYNYITTKPVVRQFENVPDVIYIASFDERMTYLANFASYLRKRNYTFNFIISGKKATLFYFKKRFSGQFDPVIFRRRKINQNELLELYAQSKVILDLTRDNQVGLSFRAFEAMGLEKKLITDNVVIKEYAFYNPNNICVIDRNNVIIPSSFLESAYEKVPDAIYHEYTLAHWVDKIFNL